MKLLNFCQQPKLIEISAPASQQRAFSKLLLSCPATTAQGAPRQQQVAMSMGSFLLRSCDRHNWNFAFVSALSVLLQANSATCSNSSCGHTNAPVRARHNPLQSYVPGGPYVAADCADPGILCGSDATRKAGLSPFPGGASLREAQKAVGAGAQASMLILKRQISAGLQTFAS